MPPCWPTRPEAAVKAAFTKAGIAGDVTYFHGMHSTQAYVVSMPDAIVLAFRGTQVDDFWSSVLDFIVDAQFLPVPDSHGDLVHAGFLAALGEVWPKTVAHLRAEQARQPRPLWITGHSLGAALATLAANLCGDDPSLRLQGVYTFGSPRAGDAGFGASIRVPVFRFRNDSDLVPHIPLGLVVPSCRPAPVHRRCRAPSPQSRPDEGSDARSWRAPAVGEGSDDAAGSAAHRRGSGAPAARLSRRPRADQLQRPGCGTATTRPSVELREEPPCISVSKRQG